MLMPHFGKPKRSTVVAIVVICGLVVFALALAASPILIHSRHLFSLP